MVVLRIPRPHHIVSRFLHMNPTTLALLTAIVIAGCAPRQSGEWQDIYAERNRARQEAHHNRIAEEKQQFDRFLKEVIQPLFETVATEVQLQAVILDDGVSDPYSIARIAVSSSVVRQELVKAVRSHKLNPYRSDSQLTSEAISTMDSSLVNFAAKAVLEARREEK